MRNGSGVVWLAARVLFVMLGVVGGPASAGPPDSFTDYVPFELGSGTIYLAPELAKKVTEQRPGDDYEAPGFVVFRDLQGRLVKISFDAGASWDPSFSVRLAETVEWPVAGETMYVSAGGYLYIQASANAYFESYKKYSIKGDRLEEVPQPYYLVDKECKLSGPATLYVEACDRGGKVATLPAGSRLRVLLADGGGARCGTGISTTENVPSPVLPFLVVTPFGLTGWVSTVAGYQHIPGEPLDCIRYSGD